MPKHQNKRSWKFKKAKRIKKTRKIRKTRKTRKTRNIRRMIGGAISRPTSHMFHLEKINEINGDIIYRIKINECYYYFYGRNKKYLLTTINDKYYMLKLDESLEDFDITLIDGIEESLSSTNPSKRVQMMTLLQELDILHLYFNHRECPKSLNLTSAKMKLLEFNTLLKEKCDNLSLHLDYVYNQHPPSNRLVSLNKDPSALILCLYNEYGCISSIIINIVDGIITIHSMTDTVFEYNKLLRCTVILISLLLSEHIKRITSTAMNPISFYLLIKYFGGIVRDIEDNIVFFNFLKTNGIIINSDTDYRALFELYENSGGFGVTIDIELTPENIEKADHAFVQILDEIVC